MALAQLLKSLRSEVRLSQEALAERAGVSTRTVSDIECGVALSPRAITLSLLAEALELGPEERERLRSAARPASTNAPVGTQLPPTAHELVGRERESEYARRLLLEEKVRLLTLVGGPGFGKTALALEIARNVESAFDTVVLAELAALPSTELVPSKVALAAGLRSARAESVVEDLAERLSRARTLLVLDNMEHLGGASAFVGALLTATPSLTVLATSRGVLRLRGERQLAVQPLAIPSPDGAAEEAARAPAVKLLLERVRATGSSLVREDDLASYVELARALEGVPLAIELAVPLLGVLSPKDLAAQLQRDISVLSMQRGDAPTRQRTMRNAIAWSYDLMGERDQRAFRRLAV
ncbi:MAG: helix-turn-helix domain-containing protein, partial [Candidatus Eremiobacteraeota bacterium]|nr:helix-turn-helix domain-containing protein [Candidatus Eremiobacteraeota bacterium]